MVAKLLSFNQSPRAFRIAGVRPKDKKYLSPFLNIIPVKMVSGTQKCFISAAGSRPILGSVLKRNTAFCHYGYVGASLLLFVYFRQETNLQASIRT